MWPVALTTTTLLLTQRTAAHITEVMARMGQATVQDMRLTQAPSRSRLAIGHIILVVLVIGPAGPIMSGAQGIGAGAFGSVATTLRDNRSAGSWFCVVAGISYWRSLEQ